MIAARDLEARVGSRLLFSGVDFTISNGNKIGLVGRNGAGKTTLTRILGGDLEPSAGSVSRTGSVAHLPQDSRTGDLSVTARDRILSARGLDSAVRLLRRSEQEMAGTDAAVRERAMRRYTAAESEFLAQGGYAAEAEAAEVTANLGLPEKVLSQPLGTLSGGQRRRVELARILFSRSDTLLLDEPTNHLDADSISWLRQFLTGFPGGILLISHDVELLEQIVNRVFYLDANRATLDIYQLAWKDYLAQRETDDRRRRRERVNAERKAQSLMLQADKMRANVKTAVAAKNMARRADKLIAELAPERRADRVVKISTPDPAPCGKTPLSARGLSKSYGSLEVFRGVDLVIDRGSRVVVLGLNGAGKTTLLRMLAGRAEPDSGQVLPGHGLQLGYFAQEHETLDPKATVWGTLRSAASAQSDSQLRTMLGSFLFSGDDVDKPVEVLSGGEKTRLALATLVASSANVLLLDEPTNNLDPVSRDQVLAAIHSFKGAIVLVSHDPHAVEALQPDRVLLLPDGAEDLWNSDYADLISLS
jgi:ATPase subunit of ABC transporter with duplicated ATPase domains